MKFKIVDNENAWAKMADEWNDLLAKSITDVPFLRHEYLTAWWNHRGGGEWPKSELWIITGRDENGSLVGIAPFFFSKNLSGIPALLLLGSIEISDFLDLIVQETDLEAFVDGLLAFLTGPDGPDWDCVDLYNLIEGTPTLAALEKLAPKHGLQFHQERIQPAPYIPLPASMEDFINSRPKQFRKEWQRKMRNAAGFFIPIDYYTVEDGDTLENEFEDFTKLMMQVGDKKEFLTDEMSAQMLAIAKAAFEGGWLSLTFLTVGRDKAAGYFNFDYNNRLWGYNSGIEKKYGNLTPGGVLLAYILQDAIENNYAAFDFMRGDEEYKYMLTDSERFVIRATLKR